MKPDWKDAPAWANWLAMDADERWHWFEYMPKLIGGVWETPSGKIKFVLIKFEACKTSLEQRP